jgi:hypothetical protein
MSTSIGGLYDINDCNQSYIWITSLVVARVGCMHIVVFVEKYTSRGNIQHITSHNIFDWGFHYILLIYVFKWFFYNVHASIIQNILSYALLILDTYLIQFN